MYGSGRAVLSTELNLQSRWGYLDLKVVQLTLGYIHRVQSMLSCVPSFWCTSGDLRVSHLAPNRRRCRLPEIRVAKPWWGESFYPKTGLQKPWHQWWIQCRALCGCRQVAANHLYEAFLRC